MKGIYVINRDGTIQVPSQPVSQVQGKIVRVNDSGSVVQCSKAKLAKLFE